MLLTILFAFVCLELLFLASSNKYVNMIKYAFVLFLVGIIAYNTIPFETDDLFRYNAEMENLAEKGFDYAMENGVWKTTFISNMILYFFGATENIQILPVITSCCLIVVFFFLMRKFYNEKDMVAPLALLFIEFIFGAFLDVYLIMNIVRNTLAMFLFIIILQLDYRSKLKNPIIKLLLYAMLPFVHMSMLPIVMIVFFSKLNIPSTLKLILIVVSPLSINLFARIFGNSGIDFLENFSLKIESYEGQYTMGTSLGLTLITLVSLVLVIIALVFTRNKMIIIKNEKDLKYVELLIYLSMAMFSVFFSSQALLFRLFPMMIILAAPYLYDYLRDNEHNLLTKYLIVFGFAGCALIRWLYQYVNYFSIWQFYI